MRAYIVTKYSQEIEECQKIGETRQYVTLRREFKSYSGTLTREDTIKKMGDFRQIYDTWEEAHDALVARTKTQLAAACRDVQRCQDALTSLLAQRQQPGDAQDVDDQIAIFATGDAYARRP